jgi:hypothetical protein
MRFNGRTALIAESSAISITLGPSDLLAQEANCKAARTRQMYEWCLGQQAQIYRQQSQAYNSIARQQWQQYQNAPNYIAPLKVIPGAGPIVNGATWAWRAPGYYYQYRYGKP